MQAENLITPVLLTMIAAGLVSLATSYVPKFRNWFKNLGVQPDGSDDGNLKRIVMAGFLLLSTIGVLVLICVPVVSSFFAGLGLPSDCSESMIGKVIIAFFVAIIANQGVYGISPRIAKRDPLRAAARVDAQNPQG